MKPTCFVLMPFRAELDNVYNAIQDVTRKMRLKCWRADERVTSGLVVRQILDDIDDADIVISDLSYANPNVFYETGVAHHKKPARCVILIAQHGHDVPFDLQSMRFLQYENTHTGLVQFKAVLRTFIKEALTNDRGLPYETILGINERTRRIVADVLSVDARSPQVVIRQHAGLSSLAISDDEPSVPDDRKSLLHAERDNIKTLISAGAHFRCILNPPTAYIDGFQPARVLARYESLINFLTSGHTENCEFVIAPWQLTHKVIIHNNVYYEGHRTAIEDSFNFTMRIAGTKQVNPYIDIYDSFFASAKRYTTRHFNILKRDLDDPEALRDIVVDALRKACSSYMDDVRNVKAFSHITAAT